MRNALSTILVFVLSIGINQPSAIGVDDVTHKIQVLYCGNPGSEREEEFVTFLRDHGFEVSKSDLRSVDEAGADKFDVVILDWTYRYDNKGSPDRSKWKVDVKPLTENFRCPTIVISAVGLDMLSKLKPKIERVCLCMTNQAFQPRTDHEIFHRPLEVAPVIKKVAAPWDAKYMMVADVPLEDQISVWEVQTKDYPEIDPGLACDSYGFEDSPDCETFSLGISDKGPQSLAIARQSNFLFWGFSAPPNDMTFSGRRLFVNAVAYISKFRDAALPQKRTTPSRLWALRYANTPLFYSEGYSRELRLHYQEMFQKHPEWIPAEFDNAARPYIDNLVHRNEISQRELVLTLHPAELIKQFGDDASALRSYFQDNLSFLYFQDDMFVVDENVKRVGIANNDVKLIEYCIAKLDSQREGHAAVQILKRYTLESFDTKEQWNHWYDTNRSRLYFSDTGGYKFYVSQAK